MDRRGNLLLDAVVMIAMFVTATAFAAALIVHANIGTLPAVIAGAAFLMVMITSHIMLTRFAQGGDADRMDDFEEALEIIDGDLQRIDKMEDEVVRLGLLTDKIEQFDRALSSFEAANLTRLSSDMETMQSRLESLRAELETEARSQREELNSELRLLERLMKQLSIDLAAGEPGDLDSARSAAMAAGMEGTETIEVVETFEEFEPIEFLEADALAQSTAEETRERAAAAAQEPESAESEDDEADLEEDEPIDMTAEAEPERHEAGAWEGDWRESEEMAAREAESWGTPEASGETGPAASEEVDVDEDGAMAEETVAEESLEEEILADEELPPEDTGETVEEEGAALAESTAETKAEETVAFAGDEDVFPVSETPEAAAAPEAPSDEAAPENSAPEEAAPEEADLVQADLGRVEAAEIEAAEFDEDAKPEEVSGDAPGPAEHEELVLTDLVAEEPMAEDQPAADGEDIRDETPESTEEDEGEEVEPRKT
jgi:hypothetical protein